MAGKTVQVVTSAVVLNLSNSYFFKTLSITPSLEIKLNSKLPGQLISLPHLNCVVEIHSRQVLKLKSKQLNSAKLFTRDI